MPSPKVDFGQHQDTLLRALSNRVCWLASALETEDLYSAEQFLGEVERITKVFQQIVEAKLKGEK